MNWHRIFHLFSACYHSYSSINLKGSRCRVVELEYNIWTCCICEKERLVVSPYKPRVFFE